MMTDEESRGYPVPRPDIRRILRGHSQQYPPDMGMSHTQAYPPIPRPDMWPVVSLWSVLRPGPGSDSRLGLHAPSVHQSLA